MMYRSGLISKTGALFFTVMALLMICKTTHASNIFVVPRVVTDSIFVKILQSKRPSAFDLYPDASHEVLLFAAKGENGKVYQLFLFNMDGKLTRQIQVRSKETTLLSGLEKGDYLFEILSDDDRIGNGNIAIR